MSFPDVPNHHALAAMLLTVLALYLFTRDRFRLEVVSLGLIVALALGFSLFPFPGVEAVSFYEGFAHEALIAVCALMVVGQGLVYTGALEPLGRFLGAAWARMPFVSLGVTLVLCATLSAFINNTPVVVLMLPILISVALRTKTSPSGILMPMGLATIVGGMTTTIGTSTNLLVVGVAEDLGVPRIGMFDFALPAVIAGAVALVYLWLIAPRLLPERELPLANESPRIYEAQLHIEETSPTAGTTLADAIAETGGSMRVIRIRRGENFIYPLPDVELKAGDRLRVQDTPANLKSYEQALKATLYSGEDRVDDDNPLSAGDQMLAEIAVVPGSALDHATLESSGFRLRAELAVLALHRRGRDIWRASADIEQAPLEPGDVLLLQGAREEIARLRQNPDFLVLDASVDLPRTSRAPVALATAVAVIVTAALGILPIAVSAVAGAALMLASGCLRLGQAIRAISPSVYFIIVASLALGHALTVTGATGYITEVFLALTAGASPTMVLSGLMLMLAVFTNVVSNNAAGVIGTPIAVGIANQLGLPAEPFVLAVLFGANMSYATPVAYKTNLLVMSAGGYTFSDFLRVGVPLTIIMWLVLSWVLSAIYL